MEIRLGVLEPLVENSAFPITLAIDFYNSRDKPW